MFTGETTVRASLDQLHHWLLVLQTNRKKNTDATLANSFLVFGVSELSIRLGPLTSLPLVQHTSRTPWLCVDTAGQSHAPLISLPFVVQQTKISVRVSFDKKAPII